MSEKILCAADGVPLKKALAASQRKLKLTALLMVAPLLAFIFVTFLMPIAEMLFRSVDNSIVPETLPRTVIEIQRRNPETEPLPDEATFAALHADLTEAVKERAHTRVGQRLNYEHSGMSSLFRSSGRKIKKITSPPYKEAMIKQDKRWGQADKWNTIKNFSGSWTLGYFVSAFDGRINETGEIVLRDKDERIYMPLMLSTIVTVSYTHLTLPTIYSV